MASCEINQPSWHLAGTAFEIFEWSDAAASMPIHQEVPMRDYQGAALHETEHELLATVSALHVDPYLVSSFPWVEES